MSYGPTADRVLTLFALARKTEHLVVGREPYSRSDCTRVRLCALLNAGRSLIERRTRLAWARGLENVERRGAAVTAPHRSRCGAAQSVRAAAAPRARQRAHG